MLSLNLSSFNILTTDQLSVTVSVSGGPANAAPTGTVTLSSGSYVSPASPLSNGSVTILLPPAALPSGTQIITANYSPDSSAAAGFTAASAASVAVSVSKASPGVTVSAAGSSITTLQSLAINVNVGTTPAATGTVVLSSGAYSSAAVTLSGGSASITVPAGAIPAGDNTFTAQYTPDSADAAIYTSAVGTSGTVSVSKVSPSVKATVSVGTLTDVQPLAVAVSLTGAAQITPTGAVSLSVGNYTAQSTLTDGSTTFNVPSGTLANGDNTIAVNYAGDAIFAGATGSQTVHVLPFIVSSSTSAPVTAGASASSTITLSAGSKYAGTVNLTCSLASSPAGAQSLPTCALSPKALSVTATGSGTSTLTVSTTAASVASLQSPGGWQHAGEGLAFATLLVIVVPRRRRLTLLVVLIGIGFTLGVSGCSSTFWKKPGTSTSATTPGAYTFQVNAVDSTNPNLTSSAKVTITVQ